MLWLSDTHYPISEFMQSFSLVFLTGREKSCTLTKPPPLHLTEVYPSSRSLKQQGIITTPAGKDAILSQGHPPHPSS